MNDPIQFQTDGRFSFFYHLGIQDCFPRKTGLETSRQKIRPARKTGINSDFWRVLGVLLENFYMVLGTI